MYDPGYFAIQRGEVGFVIFKRVENRYSTYTYSLWQPTEMDIREAAREVGLDDQAVMDVIRARKPDQYGFIFDIDKFKAAHPTESTNG